MKITTIVLTILSFTYLQGQAQISLKTEYIGSSSYWLEGKNKEPRQRIGEAQGAAMIYSGSVQIPLYVKLNPDKKPVTWAVGMSGSYVSLDNKNVKEELVLSEILNVDVGIFHKRPISQRWTLMASAGAGVYAATRDLSQLSAKNVLGSVSAVFIYRVNPNLELGAGAAVNSTFGYPMAFPALYVNWKMQGKLDFNLAMTNGLNVSAGYRVHNFLKLSLIGEMNGQMALLEKDNKDVMFSHRTLQGMFKSKDSYYFQVSPYFSTGLNIKF